MRNALFLLAILFLFFTSCNKESDFLQERNTQHEKIFEEKNKDLDGLIIVSKNTPVNVSDLLTKMQKGEKISKVRIEDNFWDDNYILKENPYLAEGIADISFKEDADFLNLVYEELFEHNSSTGFAKKVKNKYGYPLWRVGRNFGINGSTVISIPIILPSSKKVEAIYEFVFFEKNGKVSLKGRLYDRSKILNSYRSKNKKYKNLKRGMSFFWHFDMMVFDHFDEELVAGSRSNFIENDNIFRSICTPVSTQVCSWKYHNYPLKGGLEIRSADCSDCEDNYGYKCYSRFWECECIADTQMECHDENQKNYGEDLETGGLDLHDYLASKLRLSSSETYYLESHLDLATHIFKYLELKGETSKSKEVVNRHIDLKMKFGSYEIVDLMKYSHFSEEQFLGTSVIWEANEVSDLGNPTRDQFVFYMEILGPTLKEVGRVTITFLPYGIGDAADIASSCGQKVFSFNCSMAWLGVLVPVDELWAIWKNRRVFTKAWKSVRNSRHLYKAWKGLIDAPDWARSNTRLLEKVWRESDDFIEKVGQFYKTTMKKNTPAGFNGAGQYTHGVHFDDFGFPDFKPFNPIGNQHIFPKGVGSRATDFKAAKAWMKDKLEIEDYLDLSSDQLGGSPFKVKINGQWSEQMTWHHHENGKDLIPVLSNIHNTTKHVGGVKIVELGLTKLTN